MNMNEECLLQFLNNPGRLEISIEELKNYILSLNNNIIISKDKVGKRLKAIDA